MQKQISNAQMQDFLQKPDSIIVDVRPSAAFNGWHLKNEPRGGHIPNAVSFPGTWFADLQKDQILELLTEKAVIPEKQVIVTAYDPTEARAVANYLDRLGFDNLFIDSEGMLAWAADASKPMDKLPRYRRLVHPDWLAELLNGGKPDTFENDRYVLAHVNFDNWGDYNQGHIARAIWLDTLELEEEEYWNRRSPEELNEAMQQLGITHDTTVILYGRCAHPDMSQEHPGKQAGQIAAKRAALLLLYAGVKDVRVLDGGLDSWLAAGYKVTSEETEPTPISDFGLDIPAHPEYIVDMEQAKFMLSDPQSELVSVRSWEEFIGNFSGYHYVRPKGRIPGAIFGNCGTDAYHMENYRNLDNTMRNYHEIEETWRQNGITKDKHIAFYCGTGWRASEAFFAAWLMGWEKISVYDGGWFEWSADIDNPVATGLPGDSKLSI